MSCSKQRKIFFATTFLCVFVLGGLFAQQQTGNDTRRIGLFIGANEGNSMQGKLSFAQSDAEAVSKIFSELGGIDQEDLEKNVLLQPNRALLDWRLNEIKNELTNAKKNGQRTELIFYYAGHSDGRNLNLGTQSYLIDVLLGRIQEMEADVRIVIFDMCFAGDAARGEKEQYSFDDCTVLTSTKRTEQSWEKPQIRSTFFTNSLITGLRGAADADGDANVTMKELYDFVNREVQIKADDQNPQFNPKNTGSEGTVLTNTKLAKAKFVIGGDVTGRISIWDNNQKVFISDVTKENQSAMELAFGFGDYQLRLRKENPSRWIANQQLRENNTNIRLQMKDFFPANIVAWWNRITSRGAPIIDEDFYEPPPEHTAAFYTSSLDPAASQQPVPINIALLNAASTVSAGIPDGSRVVIDISSNYADLTTYIVRELTANVKKIGFFDMIVDKEVLDEINREIDRQLSGNVSDDSQVPLGRNLGADTIITGSIVRNSENTYRLYIDAIDLERGAFYHDSAYSVSVLNDNQMQTLTGNWRPVERDDNADSAINLWSLGVSMGTTFHPPWFVGTVHGTLAPFKNSFINVGVDFGFVSGHANVNYYSFYPFVHYDFFLPFGKNINWYAGAGAGYMLATYILPEEETKTKENIFAFDLCTGIIIKSMFNISLALRIDTDFKPNSASFKLAFGYIKQF